MPKADAREAPRSEPDAIRAAPQRDRAELLARWLDLTRTVLPGMAAEHGWPIRLDHCFMRVCLDAVLGAPWTAAVKPPAIRHMSDAELAAAVEVAEGVVADPDRLPLLNRISLDGRKAARGAGRLVAAAR